MGWKGQYIAKDKKPTVRMEVVCDDGLRIWHIMFETPGARNDVCIMYHITLFNDTRNGSWPSVKAQCCTSGNALKTFYYLADGIYPRFSIFSLPPPDPPTHKSKLYSAHHSSSRKAVERVFGGLFKQLRVLNIPSRIADLKDMHAVLKACCIMHNIVADHRGYDVTIKF